MPKQSRRPHRAARRRVERELRKSERVSRQVKAYFDGLTPVWDHQHKLLRGYEAMHQLGREGEAWLESKPVVLIEEVDTDRELRVVFADVRQPPPRTWSLLISDYLQSVRSALDLLVYELAEAFTGRPLPSKIARDTEFPVTSDAFGASAERKIIAIDPRAAQIIRDMQPSKLGHSDPTNPLWLLHELARLDRHRQLHLVAASQQSANIPIPVGEKPELFSMSVNAILEGKTEIASYSLSYPNRLPIGLDLSASFSGDSPIPGVPVGIALPTILRHVIKCAVKPLETFLPRGYPSGANRKSFD